MSANPEARLTDLRQANPDLVLRDNLGPEVIHEYLGKDAEEIESMLHDRLARDRVWGEWFHITPDSKKATAFFDEIGGCALRALAQDEGDWDGDEDVDWWLEADIAGDRFLDWLEGAPC